MDMTHCKHLRFRNYSAYDMDIEKFIKTLEGQYKFDFKSLPEWKKIIEVIYAMRTDYKRKVTDAAKRKHEIIENLNIEFSRLSPFELTDKLARTAKKWTLMKSNATRRKGTSKEDIILDQELIHNHECSVEESEIKSTAHPNTEVIQSIEVMVPKLDLDSELKSISSPHLPISVCTNLHKQVSSFGSKYSDLTYLGSNQLANIKSQATIEDIVFNQSKAVKFSPNELNINGNTHKEQSVKLCLTNCSTEYVFIRFKGIRDSSCFKTFRIVPATPIKLYPGLSFTFKFILTLKKGVEAMSLKTVANFKIGYNVYSVSKEDILYVPIISEVIESGRVKVTGTVNIPPAYKWQVTARCGYPKGVGQIHVDDKIYHLHIRKKYVNFIDPDSSIESSEILSPESDGLVQRKEDIDMEVHNEVLQHRKNTNFIEPVIEDTVIGTDVVVIPLLNDLLSLVFEPFVFKQTYLRLYPKSKRIFQVYFTKPDHIGFHNAHYDFEFRDFDTNEIIMTRTIKIFAEVLPHPIIINPQILDMTNSPITLGYCKNFFTITNTHKIYPVTIKIKTTTKMQKIFKIKPMETLIPTTSSVNFEVSLCLKRNNTENNLKELTYFTIKIIICGHSAIYWNSPPLFYEIIAPCAREFKQIYGRKYYSE